MVVASPQAGSRPGPSSAPIYGAPPAYGEPQYEGPAVYNFSYAVQDSYHGTNFGHSENRDGYNTQGRYFVNLPDGRLQTVDYHVDDISGFVADVKYTSGSSVVPSYNAPLPIGGPIGGPIEGPIEVPKPF